MNTVTKKTHPTEDGWLWSTITLKTAERLPQEHAEILVCMGYGGFHLKTEDYEIALCAQNGKTLKGCVRKKQPAEQAQPEQEAA